jgi:lambda repressor-like predicted transcriptional regulator
MLKTSTKATISEKIKAKAEENGVSLAWVAKKAELTKVGFYKMLDSNSFKTETLEKIATILGVDIVYFFYDEETGVVDLSQFLEKAMNEKIHIKIPEFDTTPKTSNNKINPGIYLRSISTAMILFGLYDDLNNHLEDWENDSNISKEDIITEIKKLLGEVNYSAKH